MKRRDFVRGALGAAAVAPLGRWRLPAGRWMSPLILVPMDDSQTDHLKAYGLAYRAL